MTESHTSEAVDAIRNVIGDHLPRAAIILGSGLGGLAARIERPRTIPFADIPHFARSTASGHRGEILGGYLGSGPAVPVVAMAGRLHCYEGWSIAQVTFPVAVMAALGANVLIVSNASGGLNPRYRVGDVMILRDHINLIHRPKPQPLSNEQSITDAFLTPSPCPLPGGAGGLRTVIDRPLLSRNDLDERTAGAAAGTLYGVPPDPYDPALAAVALKAARRSDFAAWQGTYLATLGPTYETRAEYRMMRRIGADAVGMSTVPEVLEAGRLGMRVLAVSMISNVAEPDVGVETSHQQVLEAGRQAEPRMHQIVQAALDTLQ